MYGNSCRVMLYKTVSMSKYQQNSGSRIVVRQYITIRKYGKLATNIHGYTDIFLQFVSCWSWVDTVGQLRLQNCTYKEVLFPWGTRAPTPSQHNVHCINNGILINTADSLRSNAYTNGESQKNLFKCNFHLLAEISHFHRQRSKLDPHLIHSIYYILLLEYGIVVVLCGN